MTKKTPDYEALGRAVLSALENRPLGSLSKRELELAVLSAAIRSGVVAAAPHAIAVRFRLTLTKANSYLTDLALREDELDDRSAVQSLAKLLKDSEITPEGSFLLVPVQDAHLRLWIERKAAHAKLTTGRVGRPDHVSLTLRGLGTLLDETSVLRPPKDALDDVCEKISDEAIRKQIRTAFANQGSWRDGLETLGAASTVLQFGAQILNGAIKIGLP